MNNAAANTITIREEGIFSGYNFTPAIGNKIEIIQLGAGATTIEGLAATVTVNGVLGGNAQISSRYGTATAQKISLNNCIIYGTIV